MQTLKTSLSINGKDWIVDKFNKSVIEFKISYEYENEGKLDVSNCFLGDDCTEINYKTKIQEVMGKLAKKTWRNIQEIKIILTSDSEENPEFIRIIEEIADKIADKIKDLIW